MVWAWKMWLVAENGKENKAGKRDNSLNMKMCLGGLSTCHQETRSKQKEVLLEKF